ncbi:SAP domain-containing protein [Aspergillus chevalieri]|uniref:SAP domain-containing protein n=1 Tax=Aspergillus chevalieri TaxID=182096 RepID=A0A7R7ZQG2_ASPCH|nr:uncharacterized protein ACHE_50782S [Aspergillus chevalieri]BCR89584.1 hypothetical protein ACHE_50782S [Aspergillus chevalieri]
MAIDYSKKTNAELVEILKSRNLAHTGKKAELVARIQEDDTKNNGGEAAPAPATKTDVADDVIDWEDDEVPAEGATKPSTEAGAAAIAAGGKGQVSNPAAVPNQKLDTDPAATDDLKVEAAGGEAGKDAAPEQAAEGAAAPAGEEGAAEAVQEKPAPNFAKGLPITELEEELKKRKARAEKFGITEESQAAIAQAEKNIERAKRFGTGADVDAGVGVKGLDEALPQEKTRKRSRNDEQGGRGGKRRNFGGRGNRPRRGGGQGGNRNKTNNGGSEKPQQMQLSEQDRAALEARKKRFAAAT